MEGGIDQRRIGGTGGIGGSAGIAGTGGRGCASTKPGNATSAKTAIETKRVYLTMVLPMKQVAANFRSDDFHFEQNALRLDALLNVGELLHRHRRWSARHFHEHALELVQ